MKSPVKDKSRSNSIDQTRPVNPLRGAESDQGSEISQDEKDDLELNALNAMNLIRLGKNSAGANPEDKVGSMADLGKSTLMSRLKSSLG